MSSEKHCFFFFSFHGLCFHIAVDIDYLSSPYSEIPQLCGFLWARHLASLNLIFLMCKRHLFPGARWIKFRSIQIKLRYSMLL